MLHSGVGETVLVVQSHASTVLEQQPGGDILSSHARTHEDGHLCGPC